MRHGFARKQAAGVAGRLCNAHVIVHDTAALLQPMLELASLNVASLVVAHPVNFEMAIWSYTRPLFRGASPLPGLPGMRPGRRGVQCDNPNQHLVKVNLVLRETWSTAPAEPQGYTTTTSAHEDHTCDFCSVSQRHDSRYSPGSVGTLTRSTIS